MVHRTWTILISPLGEMALDTGTRTRHLVLIFRYGAEGQYSLYYFLGEQENLGALSS